MNKVTKNNLIAFLASLCFFLSTIEYAIPKPLPFMRIGIANMPIIVSLYILSAPEVFLLMLLKVLAQSLVTGTLFSYVFLFSFFGSFSSVTTMLVMQRFFSAYKDPLKLALISPIGISLSGAITNTISQIIMARILLFGSAVSYVAPILIVNGMITGLLLGIITTFFMNGSTWFSRARIVEFDCSSQKSNGFVKKEKTQFFDQYVLICLICCMPGFMLQKSVLFLWIETIFFAVCAFFSKGRYKILPSIIIFFSIIFLNLTVPFGKVFFEIGSFKLTAGALYAGLHRTAILLGMVFISRSAVSSKLKLPGKIGSLFSGMFYYFECLTAEKKIYSSGKKKNFLNLCKNILPIIDTKIVAVFPFEKESLDDTFSCAHASSFPVREHATFFAYSWPLLALFLVYALLIVSFFVKIL